MKVKIKLNLSLGIIDGLVTKNEKELNLVYDSINVSKSIKRMGSISGGKKTIVLDGVLLLLAGILIKGNSKIKFNTNEKDEKILTITFKHKNKKQKSTEDLLKLKTLKTNLSLQQKALSNENKGYRSQVKKNMGAISKNIRNIMDLKKLTGQDFFSESLIACHVALCLCLSANFSINKISKMDGKINKKDLKNLKEAIKKGIITIKNKDRK